MGKVCCSKCVQPTSKVELVLWDDREGGVGLRCAAVLSVHRDAETTPPATQIHRVPLAVIQARTCERRSQLQLLLCLTVIS